jgi:hypothetical protein
LDRSWDGRTTSQGAQECGNAIVVELILQMIHVARELILNPGELGLQKILAKTLLKFNPGIANSWVVSFE